MTSLCRPSMDPQTQQLFPGESVDLRGTSKWKPFKCKMCDHFSSSKNDFYDHKKTHIAVHKQRSCIYCNYVTVRPRDLKLHQWRHEGFKPYKCEVCGFTYVTKDALEKHIKIHDDMWYRCRDCKFITKHKRSLRQHLVRMNHKTDFVLTPGAILNLSVENNKQGSKVNNWQTEPSLSHQPVPMSPHIINAALARFYQHFSLNFHETSSEIPEEPFEVLDLSCAWDCDGEIDPLMYVEVVVDSEMPEEQMQTQPNKL